MINYPLISISSKINYPVENVFKKNDFKSKTKFIHYPVGNPISGTFVWKNDSYDYLNEEENNNHFFC